MSIDENNFLSLLLFEYKKENRMNFNAATYWKGKKREKFNQKLKRKIVDE